MKFTLTSKIRPVSGSRNDRRLDLKSDFSAENLAEAVEKSKEIIMMMNMVHNHLVGYNHEADLTMHTYHEQLGCDVPRVVWKFHMKNGQMTMTS